MRVVIGIDPGVANTGFGVLRIGSGRSMTAIDGGTIEAPPAIPDELRLRRIHEGLTTLIEQHDADSLALESIYFGRNVRSAIAVGQARGVAMLAAAQAGLSCHDYTPQQIKLSVCGTGAADKAQVKHMVARLLDLPVDPPSDHAADALAVAICHASTAPFLADGQRVAAASEVVST